MEKIWFKHYEPGVPHTIKYPDITLHQMLQETAKRFPEKTAIIFAGAFDDHRKVNYKRLDEDSNKLANALIGMGVEKGDRVALLMPNCPQFVISYYAVLKAGAIVVATNPLYSPREIELQFKDSGAETVIVLSLFYKTVISVKDRTKIKNVIITNIKEYLPPQSRKAFAVFKERQEGHFVRVPKKEGIYKFQDLLRSSNSVPPKIRTGHNDIAMFQYTGGTTGISKAAVALHRSVLANVHQLRSWAIPLNLKDGKESIMGVMPLFHVYGMVTVMLFSVHGGAAMILLPRFETEQVLINLDKYKPTFFPGVPTMYVAINSHPNVGKYDLHSIKACVSGAAPLPVEVQQEFEKLSGGKLVEGFGLSETAVVTHCAPLTGKRKAASIGVPLPDVEAKIMDIDTGKKEMPIGEIGELAIKAPQVMKSYWNRDDETELVLRNGWLYTGDMAKMDEDGFFFIVDRKKEMILAGGFNIYPREVEEVLYEHPKIREAVAYGVPDPYRGETVKVAIVLKEGETVTEDEIVEFCRERLARYKVPKLIEFRDSLPKTIIGKILRRVLVEEEEKKAKSKEA